jgi:hypothetical protein
MGKIVGRGREVGGALGTCGTPETEHWEYMSLGGAGPAVALCVEWIQPENLGWRLQQK